jgi:hypothetical protein
MSESSHHVTYTGSGTNNLKRGHEDDSIASSQSPPSKRPKTDASSSSTAMLSASPAQIVLGDVGTSQNSTVISGKWIRDTSERSELIAVTQPEPQQMAKLNIGSHSSNENNPVVSEITMNMECAHLANALASLDPDNRWESLEDADKAPLVVLAFDEAHTLTPLAGRQGQTYQPSHILGRVISSFSKCKKSCAPIWTIFVSTNSRVSHFAPPNAIRGFKILSYVRLLFIILLRSLDACCEWQRIVFAICCPWFGSKRTVKISGLL